MLFFTSFLRQRESIFGGIVIGRVSLLIERRIRHRPPKPKTGHKKLAPRPSRRRSQVKSTLKASPYIEPETWLGCTATRVTRLGWAAGLGWTRLESFHSNPVGRPRTALLGETCRDLIYLFVAALTY